MTTPLIMAQTHAACLCFKVKQQADLIAKAMKNLDDMAEQAEHAVAYATALKNFIKEQEDIRCPPSASPNSGNN